MTMFDFSKIVSVVSDAASAEHTARDKWARAAKAAAKEGVTSGMLTRGTEKAPNPAYNAEVFEQIRTAIVQGVSASKKAIKFETAPKGGGSWTVASLLALTKEELKDIDDDVLKTQRRTYMQLVDGTMMSRMRHHLDKAHGVEKAREPKKERKEEGAQPGGTDPIVMLQSLMSTAPKLVSASDIDAFRDHIAGALAILKRQRA
jgi:hypothetical protein